MRHSDHRALHLRHGARQGGVQLLPDVDDAAAFEIFDQPGLPVSKSMSLDRTAWRSRSWLLQLRVRGSATAIRSHPTQTEPPCR